jgi:hypothetical protein
VPHAHAAVSSLLVMLADITDLRDPRRVRHPRRPARASAGDHLACGFERYFADLADILSGPGSPDPGQLAALAGRYGLDVDLASISRLAAAHGLKVASREVE